MYAGITTNILLNFLYDTMNCFKIKYYSGWKVITKNCPTVNDPIETEIEHATKRSGNSI